MVDSFAIMEVNPFMVQGRRMFTHRAGQVIGDWKCGKGYSKPQSELHLAYSSCPEIAESHALRPARCRVLSVSARCLRPSSPVPMRAGGLPCSGRLLQD